MPLTEGTDRVRDREAVWTDECRWELGFNSDCGQRAPGGGANWFKTKAIGDTWDASSENGHADFVAKATSDGTRGLAVCGPDAIIPFKPVRPTDLIVLTWPAFSNLQNL